MLVRNVTRVCRLTRIAEAIARMSQLGVSWIVAYHIHDFNEQRLLFHQNIVKRKKGEDYETGKACHLTKKDVCIDGESKCNIESN